MQSAWVQEFNSAVVPDDMCSWAQQNSKTLMIDALDLLSCLKPFSFRSVASRVAEQMRGVAGRLQRLQGECMELHVACKDNPLLLRGSVEVCNKKQ